MRIFLKTSQRVDSKNGAYQSFPAGEFYEVPDELGEKWVKEGHADRATKDNKVIEGPKAKAPEAANSTSNKSSNRRPASRASEK